jgi:hypothetical protein
VNTVLLIIGASTEWKVRPGQWVDAGVLLGLSPAGGEEVRAPLTGVVKQVFPAGGFLGVVLERRRDYENMDD